MEQKIIWHNENEEPQRGRLILLIMQSGTAIVAKIIEPNHTFNHGERWAYIDDLLEKQNEPNNQKRRKLTRFLMTLLIVSILVLIGMFITLIVVSFKFAMFVLLCLILFVVLSYMWYTNSSD